MTERLIEIGGLRIHLKPDEDPVTLLQSLMRHVSNQEVADILGISERTVRRWKQAGRLPRKGHARLKLADLIAYLTENGRGRSLPGRRRRNAPGPEASGGE